jgi:hypothetical protein
MLLVWLKQFAAPECLNSRVQTSTQVFAAEQNALVAQLPSMDDDSAPSFFETPSAGALQFDAQALTKVGLSCSVGKGT